MKNKSLQKVILIIRDGWGYRKEKKDNAIAQANTPVDDALRKKYPWTLIRTSGEAVGLPRGYQGNSEVGHLTIGAGRIPEQNLTRINRSIKSGEFFKKKEFIEAITRAKNKKKKLHIIGLLQKEGVHSHINHLFALLELCKTKKIKDVCIHVITDGRDSPVNDGEKFLKKLKRKIKVLGVGEIMSLSGRYYAMDRDKRWARTKKAYEAMVLGKSKKSFSDPISEIKNRYSEKETDEFIVPTVKRGYSGMKSGDSVIFFNVRTDRPRQLTQAIIENKFSGWKRKPMNVFFVSMTEYYSPTKARVAFKEVPMENLLGEVLSKNGIKQLRISETEKYAHVTYFLNGQKEKSLKGETRIMIPSSKVATYDKKPEMSVRKIGKQLVKEIRKDEYSFIIVNLVNADMVGHTRNKMAIIKAIEEVDKVTGKIVKEGFSSGYTCLVTADHGNAEDQSDKWGTSHTTNPVPFIFVSDEKEKFLLKQKKGLQDIAPTILSLMKIKKPKEMTGSSILKIK